MYSNIGWRSMNKWERFFMKVAKDSAELSYCERAKVGAVLVRDGNILSHGYNGMPPGEPNVCELDDGTTNPMVVHAEANALKKMMRSTETTVGATMFVTMQPCKFCAIDMSYAKIKAVYFEQEYRCDEGLEYMLRHGIEVYQVYSAENVVTKLELLD